MTQTTHRDPFVASAQILARLSTAWLETAFHGANTASAYWLRALTTGAPPSRIVHDTARWLSLVSTRRAPDWTTPNEVVQRTPLTALRDFSAPEPTAPVATLILPPQAGHHSCIVDYNPRQSQVGVALAAGLDRLYVLEWLEATDETKHSSIDEYLDALDRAVELAGGLVHLVGDCQGGWLATIYAALHPERVATLTIAGAPIDFHAGEGPLLDFVSASFAHRTLAAYREAVRLGNGLLRGEVMIGGFIALQTESEWRKHIDLFANLDDPEHVARYTEFEDWYKHPQAIAGTFYLWIIEQLFVGNRLVQGTLAVGGRAVDLGRIACPLTLIAGRTDHITPAPQVFALAGHVATPADRIEELLVDAGHLGLFMGRSVLNDHWLPTFRALAEQGRAAG